MKQKNRKWIYLIIAVLAIATGVILGIIAVWFTGNEHLFYIIAITVPIPVWMWIKSQSKHRDEN